MTNIHKLHQEIEELTTKLLSIQDLQSAEAQKISKKIKAKIRQAGAS